jgi:hypothetical protein
VRIDISTDPAFVKPFAKGVVFGMYAKCDAVHTTIFMLSNLAKRTMESQPTNKKNSSLVFNSCYSLVERLIILYLGVFIGHFFLSVDLLFQAAMD